VIFADLGLLVVDEEQRFGVRHKERIKQMRTSVDVLTMSATPIPRTLHMSMVGLRDMSVIETPPKDRMAIQTVVANWDEKLIQSAIEQELTAAGRFISCTTHRYDLGDCSEDSNDGSKGARRCGPRANGRRRVGKSDAEIHASRSRFLVSTTIIENGLDIPLCNTILINRADRLGLSSFISCAGEWGGRTGALMHTYFCRRRLS